MSPFLLRELIFINCKIIINLLANEEKEQNGLKQTNATVNEEQVDAGIRYVGVNPNNKVYFNCKDKSANENKIVETDKKINDKHEKEPSKEVDNENLEENENIKDGGDRKHA